MSSGIYKITNRESGKFYIGSSQNLEKRFRGHKNKLRRNAHNNIYLQRAWNKYGENAFKFEILGLVEIERLFVVENDYLKSEDFGVENELSYNIVKEAGKGKSQAKLKETEVIQIKRLLKANIHTQNEIAELFDTTRGTIKDINRGHSWISLKEKTESFPIRSNVITRKSSNDFTRKEVLEIKLMLSRKIMETKEIADVYGVSTSAIQAINIGQNWSDVKLDNKETYPVRKFTDDDYHLYSSPGEENPASKLTRNQVVEIKKKLMKGEKIQSEIASEYKVSLSTISAISTGQNWSDVEVPA